MKRAKETPAGTIDKEHVTIEGRRITLSNLTKVLYPGGRFTKLNVIDYYIRISKYILPHLKSHPVTLKRFPDGVDGESFYEKHAPAFTPAWIKTFVVARRESEKRDIRYILINNLPTLVWLANLASLEIHPFLHKAPRVNRPTAIVFDCDPGTGANVLTCARVALMLRDVLGGFGLESFVKVSGSKGLQVYVPLNTPATYDITQALAKGIAQMLTEREPRLIVWEMPKALRTRRVFIDWSQNSEYKTTAGVYSLRANNKRPFVSLPVEWDELVAALKARDAKRLFFAPDSALQRVERDGDLFQPVLEMKQKIPAEIIRALSNKPTKVSSGAGELDSYRRKRDFAKTDEPVAVSKHRNKPTSQFRFVIQKHAASHLHYDFRLEMHGVLKSWAVPKGPPLKKNEKRLAVVTEDHPLEYLNFEGIIPKGQYGGGTVMVWDIGTYELHEGQYDEGYLRFNLNGSKLKGDWSLKRLPADDTDKWLLIKAQISARPISKIRDDKSVISDRSMAEIRSSGPTKR